MYGVYILVFDMVIILMMFCLYLLGNCSLGIGVKYLIIGIYLIFRIYIRV